MRIAAFARSLESKPTGRGMVARELLQAVRRVRPGVEIDLFSGEDPHWQGVSWRPAVGANALRDAWMMLRGIAVDARAIRPDVFWSATPFLPRGLPKGIPTVATLLDVVWRDHPETMTRRNRHAAKWLEGGLRHADRIACISAFTKDRLTEHWPKLASRAEVVCLAPSSTIGGMTVAPSERPYLLNVDTLEPRKNLAILIDVVERLPDLRLVQCGRVGWGVQALLERSKETLDVDMRGYVPDSELGSLYRGALAAVFPSIYEGFHLPPLDAMSVGCPVVASDIPVHREVLGNAALFAPCHDVDAWVKAIRVLQDDPDRRAQLVEAGLKRARAFSWNTSARALLDLFESLSSSIDTRR
jgi:glycosyltransferase involved in cell wall biosynthesis